MELQGHRHLGALAAAEVCLALARCGPVPTAFSTTRRLGRDRVGGETVRSLCGQARDVRIWMRGEFWRVVWGGEMRAGMVCVFGG